MTWRVQIEGREYTAASTDQLIEWYRQRRLRPEHYVFHPVLNTWMYARDVEELRVAAPALAQPQVVVKTGRGACVSILVIAFGIIVAVVLMSFF